MAASIFRNEINDLLNLAIANDTLLIKQGRFLDTYRNRMMKTKMIVVTCYVFHFINDVLVFIPTRIFDMSSFSIATCVGKLILKTELIRLSKQNYSSMIRL